ncbi:MULTISPECIES: hypothetical protein [Bradyrhizobium]|uniref:hypothetical protein n=1 Tax=Bradyrhizobium TaxID=374 RepID=UPI001EDBCF2F|nr:hypothetical protein [Bradyrhizobium zhengyangense]MCG2642892.1 hypothetical protein [Bradyrhizobium zhengyangense]
MDAARVRFRNQPRCQVGSTSGGGNFVFYEYRLTRRAKQWHYAMLAVFGAARAGRQGSPMMTATIESGDGGAMGFAKAQPSYQVTPK